MPIALPPEIHPLIGSYLLPVDLLQCVQVNKKWNAGFIPLLWHTINSDRPTWRKILNEYDSEHTQGQQDEQWIQTLFNKHAHHIRCLKVHHRDIFRFAGQSGTCTRLESLEVFKLDGNDTLKESEDQEYNIWHGEGANSMDECEETGFGDVFLSPLFQGAFLPLESRCRSLTSQKRDWFAHQHFWLLVLANPGLKFLQLNRNLWGLSKLTLESGLKLKILSKLKKLITLEEPHYQQSLSALLQTVPTVKHLRLEFIDFEPALEVTYPDVESIEMWGSLHIRRFFNVLKYLPNLTHFALGGVFMKEYEYWDVALDDWVNPIEEPFGLEEAKDVLGGVHSRIERIVFKNTVRYAELNQFLPLFPMLKPRDDIDT
ncbi:hypothetical protein EC991_003035 [Linnemannia zychae]|nr:hypothetical protein EC991_003035 [Linnemannia zychae]